MENMGIRTQVILTDDIKEKLGAISTSRGSNLSATIRIALADWLKREYGITVNPHLQRGGGDRQEPQKPDDSEMRDGEMWRLRHKSRWSLQAIGDKYGVSRERVRQIVGNTGARYINEPEKELIADSSHLTNEQLAEVVDLSPGAVRRYRQGTRYKHNENSSLGIGLEWEERAAEMLTARGFVPELQPYRMPFDILVNGLCRIDVKVATAPRVYESTKKCVNPQWSFALRSTGADVDFYMLILAPTGDTFIVPSDVPPQYENGNAPHIRFSWPTARPKLGRYQQYHERYDLIEAWLKSGDRHTATAQD